MDSIHNLTGMASAVVAITASLMLVSGMERLGRSWIIILMSAIVIAALVPLDGLPVAAYVRSAIGDVSITTIVLLGRGLLRPLFGWPPVAARTRVVLHALIALTAATLYPLALGIGPFDPYRLGYGDLWFMGGLLALALATWLARLPLIALCIAFAVLAWTVGWYESNNLWDYLLDPLVSLYALYAIIRCGVKTLRGPHGADRADRDLHRTVTPGS